MVSPNYQFCVLENTRPYKHCPKSSEVQSLSFLRFLDSRHFPTWNKQTETHVDHCSFLNIAHTLFKFFPYLILSADTLPVGSVSCAFLLVDCLPHHSKNSKKKYLRSYHLPVCYFQCHYILKHIFILSHI